MTKREPDASYTMTKEDQDNFDPGEFVAKLKAAGFKFISEDCPIKLAGSHLRVKLPNGTVVWQQWLN
jgi:hypothetical protein